MSELNQTTNHQEVLDKYPDILEPIKVLDHGFVRLVDWMGSDAGIARAARVSYGAGTKTVNDDRGVIHYLVQNSHTSPLEMIEVQVHCKLPIFVARQMIRHRTANVNEVSGRYSVMKDEFWVPEVEDLRAQSKLNKQGSEGQAVTPGEAVDICGGYVKEQVESYELYKSRIDAGIAREIARVNLPLSLYTEWYWKMDLHNLFHFLRLRLDEHAQKEIRVYAEAIASIVKKIAPIAWEAFEEHVLHGVHLSRSEKHAILSMLEGQSVPELPAKDTLMSIIKNKVIDSGFSAIRAERDSNGLVKKIWGNDAH